MTNEIEEKKFKVDRHGEMFATFKVIADIIGAYAKTRQFWNEIQSDDFCCGDSYRQAWSAKPRRR